MSQTLSPPPESIIKYAHKMSMRFAMPVGVLFFAIVMIANYDRRMVPMLGDQRSFGTLSLYMLVLTTLVVSAAAYVLGVQAWNERVGPERQHRWYWAVLPVSVAFAIMLFFLTAVTLQFAELAFRELRLARFQAAMISGAVGAVIIHWVVGSAIRVNTQALLKILLVIIAGGVYVTAVTIDNPLWWQVSFSYLGTMDSNSDRIFNTTLIFGGIMLLIWMPYFMNDFRVIVEQGAAPERGAFWLQIGLIVLAVGVTFVGAFPSRASPLSSLIHNWSAYSLAAALGLLMFGTRWIAPGFTREMHFASWIIVGGLLATLFFAALGSVNTVGLEIIAFSLGMTWLSLFVGNTDTLARELEPAAFPQ